MDTLDAIKSGEVFRVVLWMLGEYSQTEDLVDKSCGHKRCSGSFAHCSKGTKVPGGEATKSGEGTEQGRKQLGQQ